MSNRILILFICLGFSIGISEKSFAANKKFVLVIDAGHGGKDRGATRGKYVEKDINLAVALAFGKLVEQNMPDVKVIYTRKTDVSVPLIKRANIANNAKANAFISIHVNSSKNTTTNASGVETYVLGPSSSEASLAVAKKENSVIKLEENYHQVYEGFNPLSLDSYIIFEFMSNLHMKQSLEFANILQKSARSSYRKNRGAKQAELLVLKETSMPAILIELGFVNNPEEAKFLGSAAGQKKMGQMIFNAFKEFKKEADKKEANNIISTNSKTQKASQSKLPAKTVVSKKNKESQPKTNSTTNIKKAENANQKGKILYKVQFLMSPKALNLNSPQFDGLPKISFYKDGNSYKYTAGETTNKEEIFKIQAQVRKKYKDAFIVRFQNGKRL